MNTQTSHKTKWLRSLLLLPVLALLLFSFSQTKEVEKIIEPKINLSSNTKENLVKTPTLTINQNPLSLKLNGKSTSLENLRTDFIKATSGNKSEINIEAMGEVDLALIEKIFKVITKENVSKFNLSECAYVVSYGKLQKQGKAKPQDTKTMLGYTVYNEEPIYANKKAIISSPVGTTSKQKVLSFNFKVPGQPTVRVKGNSLNKQAISYLNEADDGTKLQYFNIKIEGDKHTPPMIVFVTEKPNEKDNELIPPPPPPVPHNATKEQKEKYKKISKEYYKKYKIVDGKPIKIPAPPKPKSPLDTVVEMAKKDAAFYYNNETITSDKAIKLLKENKNLNISSSTNNGVSIVHISDKPIKIVNGKVVND